MKFKIFIEESDLNKHLSSRLNKKEDMIRDYLLKIKRLMEQSFLVQDKDYILRDIYLIQRMTHLPNRFIKIMEISSENNIRFLTIEEFKDTLKTIKVFVDKSTLQGTTKIKDFFYIIRDYEDRKKVLAEKLHMSNLTSMLSREECQDLTDGRMVYTLSIRLLKDFSNKPQGYGNPYSDYNVKKRKGF